jgi:hypothetical protein
MNNPLQREKESRQKQRQKKYLLEYLEMSIEKRKHILRSYAMMVEGSRRLSKAIKEE